MNISFQSLVMRDHVKCVTSHLLLSAVPDFQSVNSQLTLSHTLCRTCILHIVLLQVGVSTGEKLLKFGPKGPSPKNGWSSVGCHTPHFLCRACMAMALGCMGNA
jgi:hypothetical protein